MGCTRFLIKPRRDIAISNRFYKENVLNFVLESHYLTFYFAIIPGEEEMRGGGGWCTA